MSQAFPTRLLSFPSFAENDTIYTICFACTAVIVRDIAATAYQQQFYFNTIIFLHHTIRQISLKSNKKWAMFLQDSSNFSCFILLTQKHTTCTMFAIYHRHAHFAHFAQVIKFGNFSLQLRKVPLPSPFSRHIWKLNCPLLHYTTWSNFFCASTSNSNSQHMALPIKKINVFDIWHLTRQQLKHKCQPGI